MGQGTPQILSPRGLIGSFYYEYEQRLSGQNALTDLMDRTTSDRASEQYPFLGAHGQMREYEGGRQAKELPAFDFEIKNRYFEYTIGIKKEHLRRDQTGQLLKRAGELADVAADHPVVLGISLINANGLAFDGQNFFDTDHAWGNSGAFKNDIAAGDYAVLNVGTPAAPTANEMADVIMTMMQHQFTYLDTEGRKMNGSARKFQLHVPINMWGAAVAATSSLMLNTGSGSRDNPLTGVFKQGISIEVIPSGELTATDKLYLFRVDARRKPFIWQEEVPVKIDTLWLDSEWAKTHDHVQAWVEGWYNVGYGDFTCATRATLS